MHRNTYVHAVEALQQDAAARIDALLGDTVAEAVAGGKASLVESGRATTVPHDTHTNEKRPSNRAFDGSANGNRTSLRCR